MKSKKSLLVILLFIIALFSFRMIWIESNQTINTPLAENGVLDLRGTSSLAKGMIPLNGQWDFYEGVFLEPGEQTENQPSPILVPGNWKNELLESETPYSYGTYRLQILLDADDSDTYRLYVKDIVSASRLFVNGIEEWLLGQPAMTKQEEQSDYRPQTVQLDGNVEEIVLLIQVSNYHSVNDGGIIQPMKLGKWSITERSVFKEYTWQLVIAAIIVLHSLYSLLVYFLFSRKKEMLYLSLSFFTTALSIMVTDDKLLLYFFPSISFIAWEKYIFFTYTGTIYFVMLFLKALLEREGRTLGKWTNYYIRTMHIIYTLLIVWTLSPFIIDTYVVFLFSLCIVLPLPALMYLLVKKGSKDYLLFMLAAIGYMSSFFWGAYKVQAFPDYPYYPYDMLISMVLFGLFWFKQFFVETEKRQQLAVSLQKEVQQKDDFLANTSHELRNPLHGILNISQTIYDSDRGEMTQDTKQNLETLMSVGRRMTMILNDLLDREKLKNEELQLNRQAIRIAPIVTNVFDTLNFMKEGKNISLNHTISNTFPYVQADENRLFQILFNLVHNALKFSEGGSISISAEARNGMARIYVVDQGIGMDESTAKTIFNPYTQAERGVTSTGGGGIGLGLSICQQLIHLHGGTIQVDTEEGKGSTFVFTLPLAEEQSAQGIISCAISTQAEPLAEMETVADSVSRESERILVVDDDPMNLDIIKRMLVAEGYTVVACTTGKEALEKFGAGNWSLVISDVMMPYMSGYELTRELRKRFSLAELPILLLTARTQTVDIQMGFAAGANDYVRKPVEKLELMARVRVLLSLNKTIAERVRMEAAWLQAQIQPHFLFNTLNTISALSEIDQKRMVKLLEEFGNYLQQSFTSLNLEQTVSLEKELELVRSYIYIEQQRYGERLAVELDIAPAVTVQIPPLSIQTLVENAIEHGVLKRPEGGTVWVKVIENDDTVDIAISDNGFGMTKEEVEAILRSYTTLSKGVGLPNTHKRLRQLGNQGLEIESIPKVGTSIRFSIAK